MDAGRVAWTSFWIVLVAATSAKADGDPPPPVTTTVRGVVLDEHDRPLSWVQVRCREAPRDGVETEGDGRFAFDGVPVGTCTLSAWILGVPGNGPAPDVTKSFPTAGDVVLRVRRGAELRVRAAHGSFPGAETTRATEPTLGEPPGVLLRMRGAGFFTTESMSYGPTRLYVETAEGWRAWHAAVDGGALAFRRVPEGRPFVLFVAWSPVTQGTCVTSGARLTGGELEVTLEPGAPVRGRAAVPPPPGCWSGPPRDRVVARRGPIHVEGWVDADRQTYETPPLPAGPWELTLRTSTGTATVEAEAGATVALVPPPPPPIPLPRSPGRSGPRAR